MVANGEAAEGYLVIKVLEVAGHDKNDEPVWEPSFKHGYVKGARLGGRALGRMSMPMVAVSCVPFPHLLAVQSRSGADRESSR